MKKVTFEEYISNYQIVSVNNVDLINECGLSCFYNDFESHGTCFVMVFNYGGYIELTFEANFYLILGSFQYIDKDWKNIVRHLYDWCDGEYFEGVDRIDQIIADTDELLNDLKEVK